MNEALKPTAKWLSTKSGLTIQNLRVDPECAAYSGYNFNAGNIRIKFRNAKVTPKKVGQFVTLWKRNTFGHTEPFDLHDAFDFYIVATQKEEKSGFFFFSRLTLAELGVITSPQQEGKRGFRVYPAWEIPLNKQAEQTKKRQMECFIDLIADPNKNIEKFNTLLENGINKM